MPGDIVLAGDKDMELLLSEHRTALGGRTKILKKITPIMAAFFFFSTVSFFKIN